MGATSLANQNQVLQNQMLEEINKTNINFPLQRREPKLESGLHNKDKQNKHDLNNYIIPLSVSIIVLRFLKGAGRERIKGFLSCGGIIMFGKGCGITVS